MLVIISFVYNTFWKQQFFTTSLIYKPWFSNTSFFDWCEYFLCDEPKTHKWKNLWSGVLKASNLSPKVAANRFSIHLKQKMLTHRRRQQQQQINKYSSSNSTYLRYRAKAIIFFIKRFKTYIVSCFAICSKASTTWIIRVILIFKQIFETKHSFDLM